MGRDAPIVYDAPPSGGDDYIVQFHVKNGPLLRAMRARGFKSAAAFARTCGFSVQCLYRYLSLTIAPLDGHGQWRETVETMAAALHLPPESLFPPQHIDQALARSSGEFTLSADQLVALTAGLASGDTPESRLMAQQADDQLHALVLTLRPRERHVIAQHYGLDCAPHTLAEISRDMGVTSARVREIEVRALDRLNRPHIARALGVHAVRPLLAQAARKRARFYQPEWKRSGQKSRAT